MYIQKCLYKNRIKTLWTNFDSNNFNTILFENTKWKNRLKNVFEIFDYDYFFVNSDLYLKKKTPPKTKSSICVSGECDYYPDLVVYFVFSFFALSTEICDTMTYICTNMQIKHYMPHRLDNFLTEQSTQ